MNEAVSREKGAEPPHSEEPPHREESPYREERPLRDELPGRWARTGLALVPPLSLGVLGFVPSLTLALRRGTRGDWLAALLFTAVSVGWCFQIALTPEETHGFPYLLDLALLATATVGAAAHCLSVKEAGR
ncbi:hypothetical protein [Streptomyces sp. NPDC093795]|uniref:hypothetical protein n=1 Tax=Streptomyces sp. NPDC093795 TaxID=3366051 RepID=UPI003813B5DD